LTGAISRVGTDVDICQAVHCSAKSPANHLLAPVQLDSWQFPPPPTKQIMIFNEQIIQIQKQAKLIIIIHFLSSTAVTAMQSCIDSNYSTLHRHSDTLLLKTANTMLFGALHSIS